MIISLFERELGPLCTVSVVNANVVSTRATMGPAMAAIDAAYLAEGGLFMGICPYMVITDTYLAEGGEEGGGGAGMGHGVAGRWDRAWCMSTV